MDRHFKIPGLESPFYFFEDRHCGNPALLCLRDINCGMGHGKEKRRQSGGGFHPDSAHGSSSYSLGLFLLLLFSRRRPLGIYLYDHFNLRIVQSWVGCVIAASVISFPLMYRNARAAFEQVDINLIYAGRTLGMSDWKIFWKVVCPAARPGIAAGTVLTFSRAIGEYGATSMLAGNIPGKTATISQRIAMVIQNGDFVTAGIWVIIVMIIAFFIMMFMNMFADKSGNNRIQW